MGSESQRFILTLYQLSRELTLTAGSCTPSGVEDFLCTSTANFSCDLGKIEFIPTSQDLAGMYFDSMDSAFVIVDAQRTVRGSLAAPYLGGKALTQLSSLVRTGEATYRAEATFSAVQGEWQGQATVNVTKLSDGNLIVEISSPEHVRSIIFGACQWRGALTKNYELRKVRQI